MFSANNSTFVIIHKSLPPFSSLIDLIVNAFCFEISPFHWMICLPWQCFLLIFLHLWSFTSHCLGCFWSERTILWPRRPFGLRQDNCRESSSSWRQHGIGADATRATKWSLYHDEMWIGGLDIDVDLCFMVEQRWFLYGFLIACYLLWFVTRQNDSLSVGSFNLPSSFSYDSPSARVDTHFSDQMCLPAAPSTSR